MNSIEGIPDQTYLTVSCTQHFNKLDLLITQKHSPTQIDSLKRASTIALDEYLAQSCEVYYHLEFITFSDWTIYIVRLIMATQSRQTTSIEFIVKPKEDLYLEGSLRTLPRVSKGNKSSNQKIEYH